MKQFPILVVLLVLLASGCQAQPPLDRIDLPTATATEPPPAPTVIYTSVSAITTASLNPTADQTPTSTSNFRITSTLVPTPPPTPQEWLAYLENGKITIRDISGQQSSIAEGQYQQIVGWFPNQTYLLGIRGDGASIVIDPSGKTLASFDNLPRPAFWAGPPEKNSAEDWLAVPRQDAALELTSFPSRKSNILLEAGSLGADGQAFVRWGSNGEVILTPSLTQLQNKVSFANGPLAWLQQNGPDVQSTFTGGNGGSASRDFHKAYFQVLDSVPGKSMPVWLGFYEQSECVSCAVDGLELTSLDTWAERSFPLGVFVLNTPEAYAWNPVQRGLMALAEGGSRFTLENKRLALLDVPAGTPPRYLTSKDQVVFEPSWSPDGQLLAYTVLPAQTQASGSGQEMEALLGGRAIAVYDLSTETDQTLTHPAKDEIDGWPRWSADGKKLLFARKRLADANTKVWQHDLVTGEERLIVTISNAPQYCHRIGCDWEQMLAYAPGRSSVTAATPVLASTVTPIVQTDTPRQGVMTYHNTAYGFSFQYPSTWTLGGVGDLPNHIKLTSEKGTLIIGYRRAAQLARIQRTGVGSGDFVRAGSIQFLGKTLQRDRLVYGEKTKEVFYQGDAEFRVGNLVFTLGLDNNGFNSYEDAEIPLDVQKEADTILESFQFDGSLP